MALPGKAFSMSQASTRLVVATSSRHLLAYDIRRCRVSPHWDICMHCIMQRCILGDSAHTSCCPAKCTDRSGDLPDAGGRATAQAKVPDRLSFLYPLLLAWLILPACSY